MTIYKQIIISMQSENDKIKIKEQYKKKHSRTYNSFLYFFFDTK